MPFHGLAAAAAQPHLGQQAGGEHRPSLRLGHGGGQCRVGVEAGNLAAQEVAHRTKAIGSFRLSLSLSQKARFFLSAS